MSKLTQDFVEKQFKNKGYVLLDTYINNSTPMCCMKNGLKYRVSYANFRYGKIASGFAINNNPYLKENIVYQLNKIDSSCKLKKLKIIQKKQRRRILLTLQCKCGQEFNRTWDSIRYSSYCRCGECTKKIRGKKHRLPIKRYYQILEENGYEPLSDLNKCTTLSLIEVKDKDGYIGMTDIQHIQQHKHFTIFDLKRNQHNYIHNLNVWCSNNGVLTKVVGFSNTEKWTQQGIKCRCFCGTEYETSIRSFTNGKTRCARCAKSISKYENIVKSFLDNQNISYIYQYRINSCRDVLPLPFDFYLVENQVLLEVDGEGHYRPCHFNQISYENAIKSFKSIRKHDHIKTEYCKQHHIPLIRISYIDVKNGNYKNIIKTLTKL